MPKMDTSSTVLSGRNADLSECPVVPISGGQSPPQFFSFVSIVSPSARPVRAECGWEKEGIMHDYQTGEQEWRLMVWTMCPASKAHSNPKVFMVSDGKLYFFASPMVRRL